MRGSLLFIGGIAYVASGGQGIVHESALRGSRK
jgi:hypothetical protein